MKKNYTSRFPVSLQADLEERLASVLFDRFNISETRAHKIGNALALEAVEVLRPSCVECVEV